MKTSTVNNQEKETTFLSQKIKTNYFFKAVFITALISSFLVSCSSSDPVTPVAATYSYVCITSSNANTTAGDCNNWSLTFEAPGFSSPNTLRTDSFAPDLLFSKVSMQQCSAYNKTTQILLVGIGDRIVKYQYGPTVASVTPVASPPIVYPGSTVQAMEYLGTRLFIIKNNILSEYDPISITPLTTFTPITLTSSGHISNLASFGTKLYFINGATLFSLDTSLSSLALVVINSSLPPTASGVPNYDGLEVKDAATFYAVNNDNSAIVNNKFVKITGGTTVVTEISGMPLGPLLNRLSAAYDNRTEFYYGVSYNQTTNQSTIYSIDLTPLSGIITATSINVLGYLFGLQLVD